MWRVVKRPNRKCEYFLIFFYTAYSSSSSTSSKRIKIYISHATSSWHKSKESVRGFVFGRKKISKSQPASVRISPNIMERRPRRGKNCLRSNPQNDINPKLMDVDLWLFPHKKKRYTTFSSTLHSSPSFMLKHRTNSPRQASPKHTETFPRPENSISFT